MKLTVAQIIPNLPFILLNPDVHHCDPSVSQTHQLHNSNVLSLTYILALSTHQNLHLQNDLFPSNFRICLSIFTHARHISRLFYQYVWEECNVKFIILQLSPATSSHVRQRTLPTTLHSSAHSLSPSLNMRQQISYP